MLYLFNRHYSWRDIVFFLGEGAIIFSSMMCAFLVFLGLIEFQTGLLHCCLQAAVVTLVFQLCLYFLDLYDLSQDISILETAMATTQAFGFGCVILAGIYYLAPTVIISSRIFWLGYCLSFVVLLGYRFFYYFVLRRRMFVQGIVVVGTGHLACDIARVVEGRKDSVHKILAFVGKEEPVFNPHRVPVVETLNDVYSVVPRDEIQRVVVAIDDRRGRVPVETLLEWKMGGTCIEPGVSFYEKVTGKVLVERINPSWIIFSDGFMLGRWRYLLKRLVDLILSIVILIATIPVMVVSAVIIKLESKGPVFYTQDRVGEGNRTFRIIKFRSMREDAEKDGAVWARENDTRVTRFGGFIRKTRIDELPQLWNVIKGDMSLVGPRPERPVFVDELAKDLPFYRLRHGVKPGVTGWAQVSYQYGASREDALRKLEYDLYYIKNISIAFDLVVIFYTVKTVLARKGGR
ncbi:MAG: capsular biosynthesis protein CpsE [Desulfobacterales bacterium]|nr:MAG: capsular biosynthesis protein CpsE [Desulfobacterales bacterium]